MSEMPLVFFTALSQMAAGAFVTLFLLTRRGALDDAVKIRASYGIAFSMGAALLMSTTHLGHPELGYLAMSNFISSWLSREILLSSAFFFLSLLACCPWARRAAEEALGLAGSILAIAMIFATSMVYTLPSHPAWNSLYPLLFFTLTAAAAGMAFTLMMCGGKHFSPAYRQTLAAAVTLNALCLIAYACFAPQVSIGAFDVLLQALIGAALPLWLIFKRQRQYADYLPIIWGFILCGALYGRILFYAGTHMTPMFGV